MMLASLCSRLSLAETGSLTSAQRQAGFRLTAIEMPMPEPQSALRPSRNLGAKSDAKKVQTFQ
jgi:hypothetical protein